MACSLLTTITFLGERQDIFDPEAPVLVGVSCDRVRKPETFFFHADTGHSFDGEFSVTQGDLLCAGGLAFGRWDRDTKCRTR